MMSDNYRRGLKSVTVGGGVLIRYDPDGSLLEISTGVLYALNAIFNERVDLQAKIDDLDEAESIIRLRYQELFS